MNCADNVMIASLMKQTRAFVTASLADNKSVICFAQASYMHEDKQYLQMTWDVVILLTFISNFVFTLGQKIVMYEACCTGNLVKACNCLQLMWLFINCKSTLCNLLNDTLFRVRDHVKVVLGLWKFLPNGFDLYFIH